jgi:predicted RNA binding protein YcfA (HicA-like mRNA interferase family)
VVKAREVNRRIEELGGKMTRQRGSHRRYEMTYVDADGVSRTAFTTVQQHATRDIPRGTLGAIQRDLEAAFGERWLIK